jgi:fluoroquinolone transport system permease protein
VPAILAVNLQITTFFFVAGLMLLERDEGTLNALAVSPLSASGYLAMRTFSLTGLAAAETIAIVWIGFGTGGSWPLILGGTAALGFIYTCFGAAVATRYESVNALLLPGLRSSRSCSCPFYLISDLHRGCRSSFTHSNRR